MVVLLIYTFIAICAYFSGYPVYTIDRFFRSGAERSSRQSYCFLLCSLAQFAMIFYAVVVLYFLNDSLEVCLLYTCVCFYVARNLVESVEWFFESMSLIADIRTL